MCGWGHSIHEGFVSFESYTLSRTIFLLSSANPRIAPAARTRSSAVMSPYIKLRPHQGSHQGSDVLHCQSRRVVPSLFSYDVVPLEMLTSEL